MKLVKEYEVKTNLPIILYSLLPLIVVLIAIPKVAEYDLILSLIIVLLCRFPHEYFHKIAARAINVEAEVCYRRLNATCTPKRKLSGKELIIFSISPAAICTAIFLFLIILFYGISTHISYIFWRVNILSFMTYIGDFIYIYFAFTYKDCIFEDEGIKLKIYKND